MTRQHEALRIVSNQVHVSVDALIEKRIALEKRLEELPAEIAALQEQINEYTRPAWESTVRLTERQRQVLYLIQCPPTSEHYSNKEIGSRLGVTERTIKFHVSRLLAKFKKQTRGDLHEMKKMLPLVAVLFPLFLFAPQARAQQGPPSATISWNSVAVSTPAALTYKLERATAVAGPFTQIANPSNTQVTDTAVTRGLTYFYRVRASCPTSGAGCGTTASPINGDSLFSSTVSATIPSASTAPPVPTNLTIDSVQ